MIAAGARALVVLDEAATAERGRMQARHTEQAGVLDG